MTVELAHFSELEKAVKGLAKRYKKLEEQKKRLEKELQATKDLAEELEAELGEMKSSRSEALRRVDCLIAGLAEKGVVLGVEGEI